MNCNFVRKKLVAYFDGEIDHFTSLKIQEHLEHCEECRKEADILKRLWNLMEKDIVPESSPDLADRIISEIEKRKLSLMHPTFIQKHPLAIWVAFAIVAVIAGVVLGAILGDKITHDYKYADYFYKQESIGEDLFNDITGDSPAGIFVQLVGGNIDMNYDWEVDGERNEK